MKGLIYKDLVDIKKQYVPAIVLQSIFMLIIIIVALSSKYGNIARLFEEGMSSNSKWTFDYVLGILMLLTTIIPMLSLDSFLRHFDMDAKDGFRKVSISLPISISKKIASRFVGMFIFLGMLFIASLVSAAISMGILSIANVELALPFIYILDLIYLAALLVIIYMDIRMFIYYLVRNKMAEMWTFSIILIAGMSIGYYNMIRILDNADTDNSFAVLVEKMNKLYDYTSNLKFVLISSMICILITGLFYVLSVLASKMKDEKI